MLLHTCLAMNWSIKVGKKSFFIIRHSQRQIFCTDFLAQEKTSSRFWCSCSLSEIWPAPVINCPPPICGSKWSGGMGLWRMFVLVVLTHQPRPSLAFESALLPVPPLRRGQFLPLRFNSAEFSPRDVSVTREPPSIPHFFTPSSSSAATTHPHTLVHMHRRRQHGRTLSVDGAPGVEGWFLKWMGTATGMDYTTLFVCQRGSN